MGFAFIALAPIFVTIMLGLALKKSGLVKEEHWRGVEHLSFYVLFPAIIVRSMINADFTGIPVARMLAALVCGMATMQLIMFVSRSPFEKMLGVTTASYSSVFQGTGRWHTFIGLAIMPLLFGDAGLALAAVAAGAITPLSNIVSTVVMKLWCSDTKPNKLELVTSVARNPFIAAILIGAAINVSGLKIPVMIDQSLELIGKGALGIALLSGGAGLRFSNIRHDALPVGVAVVAKLFIVPVFMAFYCWLFGVDGLARSVTILAGGVPTAAVAYIFARKMGGDAPLMANITTAQIVVSAFSLPLVLYLVS